MPKCRVSTLAPSSGSNSHGSRVVTMTGVARSGAAAPSGSKISDGSYREHVASTSACSTVSRMNSPVEMSSAATPVWSPGARATRKLFRVPSSQSSERMAPGLIVSTTSRRTTPLACFGSSTCSQIATRYPRSTRRRTYSLTALTGTPASGTFAAAPLLREVSVSPSSRAASLASSKNVSKKSPIRKKRIASVWRALISRYCCIKGVSLTTPPPQRDCRRACA